VLKHHKPAHSSAYGKSSKKEREVNLDHDEVVAQFLSNDSVYNTRSNAATCSLSNNQERFFSEYLEKPFILLCSLRVCTKFGNAISLLDVSVMFMSEILQVYLRAIFFEHKRNDAREV
jgi:hypothetical protein